MAILLEPEKKPINLTALIAVIVAVVFIVGGVYFLFFAPVPGIEALVPTEQKLTTELSRLELNTQPAIEAFTARRLKQYTPPLSIGRVGRINPFMRFK